MVGAGAAHVGGRGRGGSHSAHFDSTAVADGAWMLHTAAGLIFVVGAIDSLFLFAMRHKP